MGPSSFFASKVSLLVTFEVYFRKVCGVVNQLGTKVGLTFSLRLEPPTSLLHHDTSGSHTCNNVQRRIKYLPSVNGVVK